MKKCKFSAFTNFLLCPSYFLSIHLVNGFLLLLLISGAVCDLMAFSDVHHEMSQCCGYIKTYISVEVDNQLTKEVGAEASASTQHVL